MNWLRRVKRYEWMALFASTIAVIAWTLYAFATQTPNFDLVGQYVIAQQWLGGLHDYVTIGQTHYILKIMFLYIPLLAIGVSPSLVLMSITLFINIVTLLLVYFGCRAIVTHCGITRYEGLAVGMFFVSTIAGSVYWIGYSNSRNLEVAVGIWILYGILRYAKRPTVRFGAVLAMMMGIVWMMDSLQKYTIVASGLIALVMYSAVKRRIPWKLVRWCVPVLASAWVVEMVLFGIAREWLHVRIAAPFSPNGLAELLTHPLAVVKGIATATWQMWSPWQYGKWRVVSVAVVAYSVIAVAAGYWRQQRGSRYHTKVIAIVACITLATYGLYIMSGQVVVNGTSRYLIMTMPAFLLLCSLLPYYAFWKRMRTHLPIAMLSMFFLSGILVMGLHTRALGTFAGEQDFARIRQLTQSTSAEYVLADYTVGMPVTYFYPDARVVPMVCASGGQLQTYTLFYNHGMSQRVRQSNGIVGILLTKERFNEQCAQRDIVAKYGAPQSIRIQGDHRVLLYPASQLSYTEAQQ